jgi:hypothetical protein
MALLIRDAEADAPAEEVRKLTKAKTKTEAVRRALKAQLAQARRFRIVWRAPRLLPTRWGRATRAST